MKRRLVGMWLALGMVLAACSEDAVPTVEAAFTQNPTVFINELHYDNDGTDIGEAIEIAGPAGTDLTGWSVVLYNGANGAAYNTRTLSGSLSDQQDGYGTLSLSYPVNGIQNGSPDGLALVDAGGTVVQFLSYEGSFAAVGGPADGLTSTDIGVEETASTPVGFSLQLKGSGTTYQDFTWSAPSADSFGAVNAGQTFGEGGEGNGDDGGDNGGDDGAPTAPTPIYDIQGTAHTSPFSGQAVSTSGVVTAVDSNGFYLQDPQGDEDDATSDAVFVFTSTAPSVSVGNAVSVSGTVSEFTPGGASSRNLSITQIGTPTVTVTATEAALPAPVVIGVGGRTPPTKVIDDDSFAVFDPREDGIDFFESLEGMRVTVSNPVAVSPTNRFGEIFTVADGGANATGLSERGTLNISPDDFNPERIQIQNDSGILPGFTMPQVDVGAVLEDVTGVVSYGFGNFEVLVTEAFDVVTPSSLEPEVTELAPTEGGLTVASYNVLNLDPNDADGDADIANGQFDAIAKHIVTNLRAPDILALQEIQDSSGSANNGVVDADLTYETLIAEVTAAGGPEYSFFELPPQNNQDGGQPGGNIRVGFLYNPARVDLLEETAVRIGEGNPAFDASRKSLAADFTFNGETVTVVNNHFASKGGSSPLFGTLQPSVSSAPGEGQENPAVNGGVDDRRGQAEAVKAYVDARLATDADAKLVVLGDFNEFEFISPLEILEESLVNLTETLPENERYSYIFEGNSQSLDHILVSRALAQAAEFDAVHVNSEFAVQASDHDPLLTRLEIAPPSLQEALADLAAQVQALSGSLNRGQLRALQTDLDSAERHLSRGQTRQAERSLARFEDSVRRLVRQGALTEAQGQPLVDASSALRAQL